jgi:hypothetical protein
MNKMVLILLIALAFVGCDNDNKDKGDDPPPTPHTDTITAFGKEATVIGDAALSTDDFNTAKGKLQEAFTYADTTIPADHQLRDKYNVMLNRSGFKIIIEIGNASPDANANKSMTIGVDYLLDNDVTPTIMTGINQKVLIENAFAD